MIGFATIRKDNFPREHLDRIRWIALIGEFHELRPIDPMVVDGSHYDITGSAEWTGEDGSPGMFIYEAGQIYVDGPNSMFPLAQCIADIDDAGDEMLEPP